MEQSGFIAKIEEVSGTNAPVLKFRFGIPGRVKPREGTEWKPMYKDAIVWAGSEAAKTIERLSNAGFPITPGAQVILDYREVGKEWEDKEGKKRVDTWLDVHRIDLVVTGSKKSSSDKPGDSTATAESNAEPAGAGGVDVSGIM
jgi:hypothetical protein